MRILTIAIALTLALTATPAPAQTEPPPNMREYFLVLLVNPGPERIEMPDAVFKAHMAYMNKNYADGTYVIGGPITDGSRIRGMMIARGRNAATVREVVVKDPAVRAGILAVEVHSAMFKDLSTLLPK